MTKQEKIGIGVKHEKQVLSARAKGLAVGLISRF